jgi:hypothetical protein
MNILTREQKSEEIMRLEIEASKLVQQAGGSIDAMYVSNLFPKYLKITRALAKLRDSL